MDDDDPVAPAAFSAAPRLTLGRGRRGSSRGGGDGDSAGGAACTPSVPLALASAGGIDGVAPVKSESGCLVAGAISGGGADRRSDG
jgi:hypothetical protein